ncbi:MAG: pilus assembly protein TadG-related protein [Symbiobacteriia bacterium]
MRQRLRQLLLNQRGNALILVATGLVALLGFSAVTLDAAAVYLARARAQAAADSAVLAAAQYLPGSPAIAEQEAQMVAFQDNIDPSLVRVQFSPDYRSVTVGTGVQVTYNFARILGFSQSQQGATATAKVSYLSSFKGISPLIIQRNSYVPYQNYTLRAPDQVSPGNFRALNLEAVDWNSNNGADNYYKEFVQGWGGKAYIGQQLDAETGVMASKTKQAVQDILAANPDDVNLDGIPDYQQDLNHDGYPDIPPTSERLLVIPMTDSFPNGTSSQITVVGFATFYLTGVSADGKSVYGEFLPGILHGDSSDTAPDGGARTIRLVN